MTDSPEDLDDFLAAPDNVRNNEGEKQKLIERKAQAAAEELRLKNSKSKEPASREDLLADLVLKKSARSMASRREHTARYQERYLHPHIYQPTGRELTGTECILSISDTHATFLDPFVWHSFLRACVVLEPDYIVLNGDILEGSDISRHPKIPGWSCDLQLEFDFAREMMKQLRVVAPDAEIIWTAGNHGLDRLAAYLSQVAPALACLDNLRFDKLAGVEEYGIQLAQGGSIASPKGTENDMPGLLIHDYLIHHGHLLGQCPSLAELKKALRSGESGHAHRSSLSFMTYEGLCLSWMTTPMGCVPRAGRAYMKGRDFGWQGGFGLTFLHPGGRVHQTPVICDQGVCIFEGFVIESPGFKEMPVQANWLKDFKVPR